MPKTLKSALIKIIFLKKPWNAILSYYYLFSFQIHHEKWEIYA